MVDLEKIIEEAEELEPEDGVFLEKISKKKSLDDYSDDAMVAFMLDDAQQADFARLMQEANISNSTENGEFHITLKYLGKIVDLNKDLLIHRLRQLSDLSPIEVRIGKIGVFDKDDARGVYHLQIDFGVIHTFREMLVNKLSGIVGIIEDTYPEYKPHITLVSSDNTSKDDLEAVSRAYTGMKLVFSEFHLIFGRERIAFPLLKSPMSVYKSNVIKITPKRGKR